jgi:hypothetical protein
MFRPEGADPGAVLALLALLDPFLPARVRVVLEIAPLPLAHGEPIERILTIVRDHGGTVELDAAELRVRLPLRRLQDPAPPSRGER